MAPLSLEGYDGMKWVRIGQVSPHDQPGSISSDGNGRRELYVFVCADDDSHSIIYRSRGGADYEVGSFRKVHSEGFEEVKKLRKGESYELTVLRSGREIKLKFSHL